MNPSILERSVNATFFFWGRNLNLVGYVDTNFAGDLNLRRSTIGFVFALANGSIGWMSHLQYVVALSTIEVEYMATAHANREVIWFK